MLDLEKVLREMISARFKDLRQNTPAELISNGQKTAINRIEKGVNPKSQNFVSDTLLADYADYFGIEKSELIFGDSTLLEFTLYHLFSQLFYQIVPDDNNVGLTIDRTKIQTNIDTKMVDSFWNYFISLVISEDGVTSKEFKITIPILTIWQCLKSFGG